MIFNVAVIFLGSLVIVGLCVFSAIVAVEAEDRYGGIGLIGVMVLLMFIISIIGGVSMELGL